MSDRRFTPTTIERNMSLVQSGFILHPTWYSSLMPEHPWLNESKRREWLRSVKFPKDKV